MRLGLADTVQIPMSLISLRPVFSCSWWMPKRISPKCSFKASAHVASANIMLAKASPWLNPKSRVRAGHPDHGGNTPHSCMKRGADTGGVRNRGKGCYLPHVAQAASDWRPRKFWGCAFQGTLTLAAECLRYSVHHRTSLTPAWMGSYVSPINKVSVLRFFTADP